MSTVTVDTQTLQLIAYTSLTLASVFVAASSLYIAHRQNRGWTPLLLANSSGIKIYEGNVFIAVLEFEFWNRRKYPVVIRQINVQYPTLSYKHMQNIGMGEGWIGNSRDGLVNRERQNVGPNDHHQFSTVFPFERNSDEDFQEWPKVSVYYFDPIQGRILSLKMNMSDAWNTGPDMHRDTFSGWLRDLWPRFRERVNLWRGKEH